MATHRVDRLISADTFRTMAKKGATAADVEGLSVFKAGALGMKALDDARVIEFIASNGHVDREGDSISAEGWELDHYRKNPVVLFGHAHGELPVGKALSTWIEGAEEMRALKTRDEFVARDIYPFADTVFQLLKGGYLNAVSVGFQPAEWKFAEDREGINFVRQSLLEHSVVPVPAHPEALVVARSKGIDTRLMKAWAERTLDVMRRETVDDAIRADVERFRIMADPTGRKFVTVLADIKMPADEQEIDLTTIPADAVVTGAVDAAGKALPPTPAPLVAITLREDCVLSPAEALTALHHAIELKKSPAQIANLEAILFDAAPVELRDADPIRWNRRLSKAFDVAGERFQPATAELGLVARYLDCQVKELAVSADAISISRMGAFLQAVENNLSAWQVDDIRNLNWDDKECPPVHEIIQLNSTRRGQFLIDGIRFLRAGTGMALRVQPRWFGLEVKVFAKFGDDKAKADGWFDQVLTDASAMKLLRGEAFTLSGEFLDRGAQSFDDLFLTAKNAAVIQRVVSLINEQAGAMENRGLMLVGPPGTGKTLAGRILMAQAKATFVWISSRDFARMGAFGGMSYAFDVARENAPTILFIEDVDNWLDSYTTDMLKTEMDGLVQSRGIVTILTTNYPEMMPKALLDRPGRFHDVLRFDLPDEAARGAMIVRWLPELDAADLAKAVKETAGYSGAHIYHLAKFVGTLREQDDLTLPLALDSALTKLKEQRELINQIQTQGSRYRGTESALAKAAQADRPALRTMKDYRAPAADETDLRWLDGTPAESRLLDHGIAERAAVESLAHTIDTVLAAGMPTKAQATALVAQIAAFKMGRVLSAANETRISQAASLLQEVLDQLSTLEEEPPTPPPPAPKGVEVVDVDILLLDEEIAARKHAAALARPIEVVDVDPAALQRAVADAVNEQLMLVTGRVS